MYEQSPLLRRGVDKSRPTDTVQSPSYESESSPSFSLLRLTSEDRSLFFEALDSSDTGGSTSSSTNSTPSHVSPGEHSTPELETAGEFRPRTPREGPMSEIVLFREAAPKLRDCTFPPVSSFSIHQFVQLPSIPRGLHIPLDPELFQVSDTTSSELDLSLYAFHQVVVDTRCAY